MNQFSIISYNIWFDDYLAFERANSLVNLININNPDVLCLQEVRQDIYSYLIKNLSNYPFYFPKDITTDYGSVILSRHKITKCLIYFFENSNMQRYLNICVINFPYKSIVSDELIISNIDIVVANTHFESLFKINEVNKIKIEQYELSLKILEEMYNLYKMVIFCSDTNLIKQEEDLFNQIWNNDWVDSWIIYSDKLLKYTYDSYENIYLKLRKYKFKSRLDRILFKSLDLGLIDFKLIKGSENIIEPSDHFGTYGKFEIKFKEITNIFK